jgi:hypothetical protein
MSEKSQFVIDIVNAMPVQSEWHFYLPPSYKEFYDAIKGVPIEIETIYVKLILREEFRQIVAAISANEIYERVQELQIFFGGQKIFEAYDGFVIGTVSKFYEISGTNLAKHLNKDILYISSDW